MGAMIRLQWTRYPDGFEIVEDWKRPRTLSGYLIRGARSDPWSPGYLAPINPKRHENYVLEGTDDRVFLHLANVHSDDDLIAFANKWGGLGPVSNMHDADVTRVLARAEAIRSAAEWAKRGTGVHLDEMLARWDLQPEVRMRWARFAGDSAPRFFLEPRDLFAFCVAELCQLVEGGIEIRSCPRCGKLFGIGKVGKPPTYCSAACKVSMHRKAKRARDQRTNVVRLRRSSGR